MNLLDALHHQHLAGRLLAELVSAMAGADRDRERIDPGPLDEFNGLIGIGQMRHGIHISSVSIFDTAERAEFAFDSNAAFMRHLDHFTCDLHVVVECAGCLPVFHQGSVHHYAGKAHFDRGFAGCRAVAVILMKNDGQFGIQLRGRYHQVI